MFAVDGKLKLNLGGQPDVPLAALPFDGVVGAMTRRQGRTLFSLNRDPDTIQRAYGITNVTFGAADRGGRWKAAPFVDNRFDRQYAAGLNGGIVSSTWRPQAPNVPRAVDTTEWLPPRTGTATWVCGPA